MPRKTRDPLAVLASMGTRAPRKSDLETFIDFLREGGTIVDARPDSVQAGGDNIDRYFRPEGGLTKAHFDALAEIDRDASDMVAQAVVENMLRRQGLPAIATHWAAESLGSGYWEQVENPEDFQRAADDVELTYHRKREEMRREQQSAEERDDAEVNPHGDWSVVVTSRGSFPLTRLARLIVPVVYQAHIKGEFVTADYIRKAAKLNSDRIDHCLRHSEIWGEVVAPVPGKKGFWRFLP